MMYMNVVVCMLWYEGMSMEKNYVCIMVCIMVCIATICMNVCTFYERMPAV